MHMRQKQHETYLHIISGKLYFQFRHISCYANSMQTGGKPVQKKKLVKKWGYFAIKMPSPKG